MAKLTAMPDLAVIAGLKKSLDFYYWRGIPCVRSWPTSPGKDRAQSVSRQWPTFIYAAQEWNNLSPEVQAAWRSLAANSGLSARDMMMRGYLKGAYRYDIP